MLTEQIFTIPGFGKLVVDAVFNRDYAVVQGVVLCTAVGFIVMNLLGRRPLRSGQPTPEARTMTIAIAEDIALPKKRSRILSKFLRNRSAAARRGPRVVLCDRRHRGAADRTARSDQAEFCDDPESAVGAVLVRHGRTRT